jgi:LmbE family N-acetylglucosaminyl deacetylase
MSIAIISPHLDDAAFSLAEHILTWVAEGEHVKICTVYGGIPADEAGNVKHTVLHAEHIRACEAMGVQRIHANFFDDVYTPRPAFGTVSKVVHDMIGNASLVVVPVGIHHPDHQVVAATADPRLWSMEDARYVERPWSQETWLYDELPYYVDYPHEALTIDCDVEDCRAPDSDPARYERVKHAEGLLSAKKRICRMYASQVDENVERRIYAPERLWRPL